VPNAEDARENRQSALFSTKGDGRFSNEELLLQPCHAKDLTIRSRSATEFRALATLCGRSVPVQIFA